MKYLSLLVGVLILGNVACVDEEPGVIEFTGSVYVQITGELGGEPNEVTGRLMLGLVQGLTTGNCWGGNTDPYITGIWTSIVAWGQYPGYLTWRNMPGLGEITVEGGDGSCDSVIYVGITKVWPWFLTGGFTLWEAEVGRWYDDGGILREIQLAEQEPHGSFNDTVNYLDYVQPSWELTAHLADASGEGNFGTAQLTYDLAEGMGYDNMPYGLYLDFYYNNADTSRRTVSAETWVSMDTSEVRAIYTTQDTIRNRELDSLYGIALVNSRGGIIARDTVTRYIPANNAVKWVETIYLVKWPGTQ